MHYNSAVPTRSLYIHWPFCPYKCHFCPFVALASHDQFMTRYHHALCAEIRTFAEQHPHAAPVKTIHIGGGTPSTYPPALLQALFEHLHATFSIEPDAEIALEINPGTLSEEKIATWKQVGINRLSIGVQSINDKVLTALNRHQTADQVYKALASTSHLFENISIDLILGLPGITTAEWQELIAQALLWPIKHISIYFLTVHENTPLYFKVQSNQITLPLDDDIVALYEWTCATLAAAGFMQYELSNFAQPGFESRHNTAYWERVPYKGFGIGACSFDGARRFQNEKNIMRYMELCEQNAPCITFTEALTEQQQWLEYIMLNLRRPMGVSLAHIKPILDKKWSTTIELLVRNGYIEYYHNNIRLTRRGLTVENEVLAQLVNT